MTANSASLRGDPTTMAHQAQAANGLAIVRVTIGAMLVWVFFENLGKGLYTPAGYASLIHYYIKASHSPAAWKAVMSLAANHAAMVAPMQAVTEISRVSECSRSVCPASRICGLSASRQRWPSSLPGQCIVDSYKKAGPLLVSTEQPRAAIHFETAMRQGLLHSQIGHWPRRSAPVSVVTGPDSTQQSS